MILLDDSSPAAIAVDKTFPSSSVKLQAALVDAWPRLAGRVRFVVSDMEAFELQAADVVVSVHACGALTDVVLDRAGVLPCCHQTAWAAAGRLAGWMDRSLAIDAERAWRLEQRGYRIRTQRIAPGITPKARLLLGEPRSGV